MTDGDWRALADELGPLMVLVVRNPATGLEAFVVVDNVDVGPAIGGVRLSPTVTVVEVARLARAMTLKNAMAGLPHGGAKAGIVADPQQDPPAKERLVRSFAAAIRHVEEYVPGPDMGTDETAMAWVHDEIGRAVGLPAVLGGIPLDEIGATGFGLAVCAEAVEQAGFLQIAGARVAIHGFGAVGRHTARFLAERGAVLVAVSDSKGGVADPSGLPLEKLLAFKARHPVGGFPDAHPIARDEVLTADCDLLVPAAVPDVITAENAAGVRASVVLEGANIPVSASAETALHARGVLCVPDFVANAGGVICAAVEYAGGTRAQSFAAIEEKIRASTAEVLSRARAAQVTPRQAADGIALARLAEARAYRRSW